MKFLVLSSLVAFSYAAPSFYGLVAHPNGAVVPADEPAVAAARADHLAAKGVVAHAAYAPAVHAAVPAVVAARADHLAAKGAVAPVAVAAGPVAHAAVAHPALVAHPNGAVVPVDEPAVAAARAAHLKALSYGH